MKIVFSTDQIYLHGGLEKVMAEKANYFVTIFGFEVYILTTQQENKPTCYALHENIKLIDIGINYNRDLSYFHIKNVLKIPVHFSKMKSVLDAINPDVIIICNYAFDFYWAPFINSKALKFKEYHSSRYDESIARRKNKSFLRKLVYNANDFIESKYDKLILLNPDEKVFFKSFNLVVIPNSIPIQQHLQAGLNSKNVIAAGRIAPVKGFENLIQAWVFVANQEPESQLHIYGQGEKKYVEELQLLINENKLENTIFIKDATNNLLQIMTDYSLYVLTSHSECFPMVLLESLSIGLPIVSFDCPTGPKNIITNCEDGILVTNGDHYELANKIVYLLQNKDIRIQMGKFAIQKSKQFATQNVMKNWFELFQNCR